jgi:hypothetical protein
MLVKIVNSLSENEYVLVRETAKAQMAELDEDELIELHILVRRARNKYVTLYRRAGATKVKQKGGRGAGKAANTRNAAKAEVFEDALSRVSRQLAGVARRSARELKDERLALARSDSPSFGDSQDDVGKVRSRGKAGGDTTRESPGRQKYEASTRAAGARRQAKKDKR